MPLQQVQNQIKSFLLHLAKSSCLLCVVILPQNKKVSLYAVHIHGEISWYTPCTLLLMQNPSMLIPVHFKQIRCYVPWNP